MVEETEQTARNNMIIHMEKTLNSKWFSRHNQKDEYCTLSSAQYWDWLVYIDVSTFQLLPTLGRLLNRIRSHQDEDSLQEPSRKIGRSVDFQLRTWMGAHIPTHGTHHQSLDPQLHL